MTQPAPWAHQQRTLDETWHMPAFALFWEQRTGKTRTTLETAARLQAAGRIDAVLIVTVNGVHHQWAKEQRVLWLPQAQGFCYSAPKAKGKAHQASMAAALTAPFPLLAISYDGYMSAAGRKYVRKFLTKRRALLVLDESTEIKASKALRTRALIAEGKYAPYRRILTGTPVANGPFDVYSQVKFLDTDFWWSQGISTPAEFRARYAYLEERRDYKRGHLYRVVVKDPAGNPMYRNLDDLETKLARIGNRVLRADVYDAPPKLYSTEYFELSAEQRRVYDRLAADTMVWLHDGTEVNVPLTIVRVGRLAQIACNYLPSIGEVPPYPTTPGEPQSPTWRAVDPNHNPRLERLQALCAALTHPALIWCRWTADVDQICRLLSGNVVRYDGRTTEDERVKAKATFMGGGVQFLVGNPAVGAMGLDFSMARTVIYYSNSYNLLDRQQSEDRAQGPGQQHQVSYVDLVAADTIDVQVLRALRAKECVATTITAGKLRAWLQEEQ